MFRNPIGLSLSVSLLVCFLSTGCVSGPMTIHAGSQIPERTLCSSEGCVSSVQIVQGNPNQLIDGLGWIVGIPRKVILWNRRVDNHSVQPETMAEVAMFAEINQLDGVCVRVNQYAPVEEWNRLMDNDRVSPGWRYTMGTLSLVGYTLLPGRIFGGDHYNPYTNSVSVHSDVPALAMEAAAYAKDVQSREFPGTYAAVNQLPIVSIWHETINTQDTLAYLEAYGSYKEQKDGLAILYPNYGASVGGAFGSIVGATPLFEAGGALVGHFSGRHKASKVDPEDSDLAVWKNHRNEGQHSVHLAAKTCSSGMNGLLPVSNRH